MPIKKTTNPTGIVTISKKAAAPPPVVSSLTNRIGQNATHAEITEIVAMLPTGQGVPQYSVEGSVNMLCYDIIFPSLLCTIKHREAIAGNMLESNSPNW